MALPVEVLEKYTDIDSLKDGDRIFSLNGHQICCVYIPDTVKTIGKSRHAFGEYLIYKYIEGLKFPYEEYRKYEGFWLYCVKGSRAEYYAIENHLSYSYT